jgi:hypothetical protein
LKAISKKSRKNAITKMGRGDGVEEDGRNRPHQAARPPADAPRTSFGYRSKRLRTGFFDEPTRM